MNQKNYAFCKRFESPECPHIFSRALQRVYTPNSIYKGSFNNIADDENIIHAMDMCASCKEFQLKQAE